MIPLEEREIESQIALHVGAVRGDWEAKTKNYISANPDAYSVSQLEFNVRNHISLFLFILFLSYII